jgi:hypothetical protein
VYLDAVGQRPDDLTRGRDEVSGLPAGAVTRGEAMGRRLEEGSIQNADPVRRREALQEDPARRRLGFDEEVRQGRRVPTVKGVGMVGSDHRPGAVEPHTVLGALEPEAALQRERHLDGMMGVDVVRRSRAADPEAAPVPDTDLASPGVRGHAGSLGDIGVPTKKRVIGAP